MGRRLLQNLDRTFAGWSQGGVILGAMLLAVLLGVADYLAPPDLLILFLLPIFLAAWYGGRRAGMVVAIYSGGATYVVQTVLDRSSQWTPDSLWSLAVRLVTFLIFAVALGRLKESLRQQRELTGFIVHDLRSPISSAITGLLTLQQTSDHLGPEDREMVDLALVSNQRALTLVNSILDVAKLERGKMEVRPEEVEVSQLIQEAIEDVLLWAKGNEIKMRIGAAEGKLWCDANLTRRVLVNLLSNALKFSPPGAEVVVNAHQNRDHVRFAVIDHGPGIPAEYRETIFQPFGQVKNTKGGTGLGLTFCRLAVHAQGGRIWVESALGKGTTMLFTLANHPPRHAPAPVEPDGDGEPGKEES